MSRQAQLRRNTVGGIAGNILEWYDFAVFGYLAPVIGAQFFPTDDRLASTLNAFGVFAVGYLMRPLGGILFGHFGDRFGRKRALVLSVMLMAIPTVMLGLLPTYAQWGVSATVLLVVLRLLQGLAVGGEYVGSISFITEIAPSNRRGLWGSLTSCSVNCGLMLGSSIAAAAHYLLESEDLAAWGWRIPFLLGIVVGLFGVWLRAGLVETEEFERVKVDGDIRKHPLLDAIRSSPGSVVRLLGLLMLFGGGYYALFVWWPTYLTDIVDPPIPHAFLVNTLAIVILTFFTPLAGLVSDLVGRRTVLVASTLCVLFVTYPLTAWTDHGSFLPALISQMIFAVIMSAILGPMAATMAEMFPTRNRYSGVAFAYNITVGVVGGTAPLVCTWITSRANDLAAPAFYLMFLACISLTAALGLRPSEGDSL